MNKSTFEKFKPQVEEASGKKVLAVSEFCDERAKAKLTCKGCESEFPCAMLKAISAVVDSTTEMAMLEGPFALLIVLPEAARITKGILACKSLEEIHTFMKDLKPANPNRK